MTLSEATTEIKERWREFLPMVLDPAKEKVNGSASYICPFCHHGKNGDGLTHNPKSKTGLICFGCGFSGSDIDLYARMTNRDANDKKQFLEVVKDMADMMNIIIDDETTPQNAHSQKKDGSLDKISAEGEKSLKSENTALQDDIPENSPGRYRDFILQAAKDLFEPGGSSALDYLHQRGLSDDMIRTYKIGFSENDIYFVKAGKRMPAIIFPHDLAFSYYSARSVQDKYFSKPKESQAGKQILYNGTALQNGLPCFICESPLDALAVNQSGGNAVALNGTAWRDVLMPVIEQQPPKGVLVLCLDNDQPDENGNPVKGQKAQAELADALKEKRIPFISAHFSLDQYDGEKKDANDLLRSNADQLKADIESLNAEAQRRLKPDNTKDYILNNMRDEIIATRQDARRKTGFANLDYQMHSLSGGLYFIGGQSSVGKTSWTWQLADQLAERGEHVLFFSLEMSKLEMISKSIARYTAILDKPHAVTSAQIRLGARGELIEKAADAYIGKVQDRISVIQGDFNFTVQDIGEYLADYIAQNNVKPVCIIDYLQILQPAADPETGRKATDPRVITSDNVVYLKRLSRQYKIPIIVTSALNRSNYLVPIDYESFRETSAIEYSADFIAGLQLSIIHDETFADDGEKVKKREKLNAAKKEIPRKVELSVLKNRWGISNFSCQFLYYPQFDYFEIPPEDMPEESEREEWRTIDQGEQMRLPFDDVPIT